MTHTPDTYIPERRGVHKTASSSKVGVCASCNNGWMSELENKAKPFIGPMALGHGTELTVEAQAIVATWAIKTCFTAMLGNKTWMEHEALYNDFFKTKAPAPGHVVSTAAYSGENWCQQFQYLPIQVSRKPPPADPEDGHYTTLIIGNLMTQVMYFPFKVGATFTDKTKTKSRIIWPATQTLVWPTGILRATEAEAIAKGASFPSYAGHPLSSHKWIDSKWVWLDSPPPAKNS